MSKTIIWWGKGDIHYSRNRIIRQQLQELGYHIVDFRPKISALGDIQAAFSGLTKKADYIWVPCFRQRDFEGAYRYSSHNNIPIIFDPLISAYDKQVYERKKLNKKSRKAHQLRYCENHMMAQSEHIIADTAAHRDFFVQELGASAEKITIIPVSAEAELFQPQAPNQAQQEVLFYGSFVPLQGADLIVQAAKLTPHIKWTLLGDGKGKEACVELAKGHDHIHFEPWIDYADLPSRIGAAKLLLGVFGDTPKAKRVIPNKVYQSLACGRPVISIQTSAYLHPNHDDQCLTKTGILQIENTPEQLSQSVLDVFSENFDYEQACAAALETYQTYYSQSLVKQQLELLLTPKN